MTQDPNSKRAKLADAKWSDLKAEMRQVMVELAQQERTITYAELCAAHDADYVNHVLALAGTYASLDAETHLGPRSVEAARHAAGACLSLIEALISGAARRGFALVRPPGHHASAQAGSGFCVFNNIAIAACQALRRGVSRVLVVDWDVHHGNGTQAIFYERSDVYFCDVHQDGLWPDTGAATETGAGAGLGYTRNIPLMPLSSDDDYLRALEKELPRIGESYRPELLLVSCGFDAHAEDPEGGMALSADGYARLTRLVRSIADRHAGGRLGLILEGGYLLSALPSCAAATLMALSENG